MNWFDYYVSAFKNLKNYRDVATQKELNIFIFFMIIPIVLILFWFLLLASILVSIFNLKNLDFENGCIVIVFVLLLINFLPFIALVKRRINYVFPDFSNKVFIVFCSFI